MAILDKTMELSDAQAIFGSSTGAFVGHSVGSANAIYVGSGYDEFAVAKYDSWGEGGNLWLNVRIATALVPISAPIKLTLQTSTTAAAAILSSGATTLGSWTYQGTGTKSRAGDTILRTVVPIGASTLSTYIGLLIENTGTTAASTLTAGAIDAWIGLDSESDAVDA